MRAAGLALLLVLAIAAPAQAAPQLVALGSFSSPTFATSPVSEPTRVFVTERIGRVRVIVDETVQTAPFLDLTAITRANLADPASGRLLLAIDHPQASNHNGGQLQIGPDGKLWLATGDGGGGGNNQFGHSQNPQYGSGSCCGWIRMRCRRSSSNSRRVCGTRGASRSPRTTGS